MGLPRLSHFRHWLGIAALSAGLMLVPGAPQPASGEPAMLHKTTGVGPRCRLAKIDSVYFKDGGRRGWYLYIGGLQPFANMDVGLDHHSLRGGTLTLEVVGCTPNFIALPIPTPYWVELPLRDIPRARRVRIVGENGTVTRRLPGR